MTGSKKRDHISPVLSSIHWLPVKFKVDFKILLFVYKALSGCAPSYISELLVLYCPARTFRSLSHLLLTVPWCRYKLKGGMDFSVAGPKLWNGLPYHVRSAPSLDIFKSRLKSYFYYLAFVFVKLFLLVDLFVHCTALWTNLHCVYICFINKCCCCYHIFILL